MLAAQIFSLFALLSGAPTATADDPPGGPDIPIYYKQAEGFDPDTEGSKYKNCRVGPKEGPAQTHCVYFDPMPDGRFRQCGFKTEAAANKWKKDNDC
jgi:hypothetical protein